MAKLTRAELKTRLQKRAEREEQFQNKEWYTIRSVLGNSWAIFYILLGGRERGKSYSVMQYCLRGWKKRGIPFYWIRLNEASMKKMLSNNAAKFVDPDLYRDFDLELSVKGNDVFDHGKKMATVLAISTAHNDKGVALFDNEYDGMYNIVLDEFQLEKSQKRTFDVSYNLVIELENLVRSRKDKVRIFMIGNTTEEVSDVLAMFNFIPMEFGVYKLRSKRCVIDYMGNTEAYMKRRKGTVGDILAGNTSNYTNEIKRDISLIDKSRLVSPQYVVKFSKDTTDWFIVWHGNIVSGYQNISGKPGVSMRRYIDDLFDQKKRDMVFELFDARAYRFHDMITQKKFAYQLALLKAK